MSRKSILALIGVLGALIAVLTGQFGLSPDAIAAFGGLTAVIIYIFGEMKLDLKRIGGQSGRFKDPKFWLAVITALLAAVNKEFGLNLPAEYIVGVLNFVLIILFGKKLATS